MPMPELSTAPWRNMARILTNMYRPDLPEDERDEVTVLALLEVLRLFGDPLRRPAKEIPWPKSIEKTQVLRPREVVL